jgi:hypothetical protein
MATRRRNNNPSQAPKQPESQDAGVSTPTKEEQTQVQKTPAQPKKGYSKDCPIFQEAVKAGCIVAMTNGGMTHANEKRQNAKAKAILDFAQIMSDAAN